jgi:hypothetical protein
MSHNPKFLAALLALGALFAAPASFAACTYPHTPGKFPDGATASQDEMVAAQGEVKQFMADMDAYLKCIDEENPAAKPSTLNDAQKKEQEAREKVRVQKHNAAVSDEDAVADRFNTQLHIWKDRQAKN